MFKKILFFLLLLPFYGHSQNEISITSVRLDPSLEHVGVFIEVDGDENRNASIQVNYRIENEVDWNPSAPFLRTTPGMMIDGEVTNFNHFAGSVMFLNEDTDYEIQVVSSDPDGGSEERIFNVTTLSSIIPDALQTFYVAPGNGGGDGSEANPFLGVETCLLYTSPSPRD